MMQSLRQAFHNAWQAAGPPSVCDMCPLHHLHQLCAQLEGKYMSLILDGKANTCFMKLVSSTSFVTRSNFTWLTFIWEMCFTESSVVGVETCYFLATRAVPCSGLSELS